MRQPPRTVALDIETTGLNRARDRITVVCLYGHIHGPEASGATFNFLIGDRASKAEALARHLDAAERISCFNGTRFDIPFMQTHFGYEPERVGAWVLKMFDVFDIAKGVLRSTFKLDQCLFLNGMRCKTASGAQAVEWAKQPADWKKLEDYCMQDTRLTFLLSQRGTIKLPVPHPGGRYNLLQDGSQWSLAVF